MSIYAKGKNPKKSGFIKHRCMNCSIFSAKHARRFMHDYTEFLKPKTKTQYSLIHCIWHMGRRLYTPDLDVMTIDM
jgi:hypothetical protein